MEIMHSKMVMAWKMEMRQRSRMNRPKRVLWRAPPRRSQPIQRSQRRLRTKKAEGKGDGSMTEAQVNATIHENKVKALGFKALPEDMRDWVIATCRTVYKEVDQVCSRRTTMEANGETADMETCLEEAETRFKTIMKDAGAAAEKSKKDLDENYLYGLKVVHTDQESIGWCIMKREAKLRKLEQDRDEKKKKFKEIKDAASSLIRNEEGEEHNDG
eukprot:gnl/TRDRNA2_/TRDRNA2_175876_c2_seq2.p2 gnl/TRDRNA2_/TRDRNA2_175876_c2~~gnl/TRDRNA2_/TRDRNA2_175876_c2_seq2.p2  ORF type:complete len:215 (-),score=67.43 gnl/TRDRNA2_/TRDRNA2_175876_c2_seq2:101-745(-)